MSNTTTQKNAGLSVDFLQKMKEMLSAEKARLEKDLSGFAKQDGQTVEENFNTTFPKYGDDEEDNVQEVADYAANLSIEQGLEKLLRDINSALERMEKGTYGICKYCKKPMDEKRLLARPTSSACVECKKTIVQEV